ncbi:beta-ketoacyl synthase chain length factor [Solimicrobium silvestre]|uniref:Beta-ketoacyl synthase, N-terminal domain n=1 Tax=Solimicrobium silvestre TaxID=2099400 RepID=A0A2S9H5E6_9BURK|nr:beta-ketoacyl synthase chain length factor [Solimicrobium silvestre]PRC95161.1 Beta-ketoacyl synthase, N-terminal domain [Solimicrobium silvestre]
MQTNKVQFSVAAHAAWAPNLVTNQEWNDWAEAPFVIQAGAEPSVLKMPSMLRRRAGFLGKMALEVAYQCLDGRTSDQHTIPTVFCSRHGDVSRAMELLANVVQNEPLSPTSFGLAVHNASAGLFSIARSDQANHIALAAGQCTIEHGVIEACSLLADGAPSVLLVVFDNCLPSLLSQFEDCEEQPHAWAWLMVPAVSAVSAERNVIQLSWKAVEPNLPEQNAMPASLEVLKFYLRGDPVFERTAERRLWSWSRSA